MVIASVSSGTQRHILATEATTREWLRGRPKCKLTSLPTQQMPTATQILPRLQALLAGPGPDHHVQKRTPMNLLEELQVIFRKWSNGDLLADVNRGIVRETVQTTTGSGHVERLDGSSDRCIAGIENVPLSTETGSRVPELQIGTCYAL